MVDCYVHYTKSRQNLQALCGKEWEWISDYLEKVTCPDCIKEIENEQQPDRTPKTVTAKHPANR